MRLVYILLICLFSQIVNAQMHLHWTDSGKIDSIIPEEKLYFYFDSSKVKIDNMLLMWEEDLTSKVVLDSMKAMYKYSYNHVVGNKRRRLSRSMPNDFRYILRLTPLKFYVTTVYYSSSNGVGASGGSSSTSYYFVGDYKVELISKADSSVKLSMVMTNLTNPTPYYTLPVHPKKPAKPDKVQKALYVNIWRAGRETAKHMIRLVRRTKF
ncbi:MAG: hypothetical protein JST26_12945 [Bacteroidetes bacterium]|nr:hypothetical protein [Bacteroidota bacterium]